MRKEVVLVVICIVVTALSCKNDSVSSFNDQRINKLMSNVDEDDPRFTQKDVKFDSVSTVAGQRSYREETQNIKVKIFYFGDLARGYYNIRDLDDKNLQIFGKKVEDLWVYKCVTKINMEEAGAYLILDDHYQGIWSSGHINYEKQSLSLKKQKIEYTELTNW